MNREPRGDTASYRRLPPWRSERSNISEAETDAETRRGDRQRAEPAGQIGQPLLGYAWTLVLDPNLEQRGASGFHGADFALIFALGGLEPDGVVEQVKQGAGEGVALTCDVTGLGWWRDDPHAFLGRQRP